MSEIVELLEDLSRPLHGIVFRRMFGGHGLFRDGLMFALVIDERLYFKADGNTRPDFDAEDLPPFTYPRRDGTVATLSGYRLAPERLFDDADEYGIWARAAIEVARRAAAREAERMAARSQRRKRGKPDEG